METSFDAQAVLDAVTKISIVTAEQALSVRQMTESMDTIPLLLKSKLQAAYTLIIE